MDIFEPIVHMMTLLTSSIFWQLMMWLSVIYIQIYFVSCIELGESEVNFLLLPSSSLFWLCCCCCCLFILFCFVCFCPICSITKHHNHSTYDVFNIPHQIQHQVSFGLLNPIHAKSESISILFLGYLPLLPPSFLCLYISFLRLFLVRSSLLTHADLLSSLLDSW